MDNVELVLTQQNEISLARAHEIMRRSTYYAREKVKASMLDTEKGAGQMKSHLLHSASRKLADIALRESKYVFRQVPENQREEYERADRTDTYEFETEMVILSQEDAATLRAILYEAEKVFGPYFKSLPAKIK